MPLSLLLEKALELPAAKRLNLATELLESVEGPEDPDWAEAWRAELDRRAAEFDRGEVQGDRKPCLGSEVADPFAREAVGEQQMV